MVLRILPILLLSIYASIACASESVAVRNTPEQIAVLDLQARDGLSDAEAATISDRLRGELVATGRFVVLERSQVDAILREQGFQQSGACGDAECLVEVGQLLAVQRMVGGSIGRIGKAFSVNLKVIEVGSGAIINQTAGDFKCSLEQLVATHVRTLARRIAGLEAEKRPLLTRWFFWAPVGAVVAGAAVAVIVLTADNGDDSPEGGDASITVEGTLQ